MVSDIEQLRIKNEKRKRGQGIGSREKIIIAYNFQFSYDNH